MHEKKASYVYKHQTRRRDGCMPDMRKRGMHTSKEEKIIIRHFTYIRIE
jgi:hypothetical protein